MGVWKENFSKIQGYAGWHTLMGVFRGRLSPAAPCMGSSPPVTALSGVSPLGGKPSLLIYKLSFQGPKTTSASRDEFPQGAGTKGEEF